MVSGSEMAYGHPTNPGVNPVVTLAPCYYFLTRQMNFLTIGLAAHRGCRFGPHGRPTVEYHLHHLFYLLAALKTHRKPATRHLTFRCSSPTAQIFSRQPILNCGVASKARYLEPSDLALGIQKSMLQRMTHWGAISYGQISVTPTLNSHSHSNKASMCSAQFQR